MAIYPIWNPETGEQKVIEMSVHDIMEWYENNKPWCRDWSKGGAAFTELGDWRNKLVSKHPSWNEVLKKTGSVPGSNVKPY